jgi:glycerol-3-phosphate dehydrogenase
MEKTVDIFIVGGGINGCGCAAEAALRGLSVMLCEKGDLASQTSSKSTKLIHGGLRYLEQYHFSLVKKALDERQKLMELAPHLVQPLELVMPYHQSMRPSWLIRSGLFVYDHLSRKNKLPKSHSVNVKRQPSYFAALKDTYKKAFIFYDGSTQDSRLTIANALQARRHGAEILNYTALIDAKAYEGYWTLTLKNTLDQSITQIKARCLINAAGPWVNQIHDLLQKPPKKDIKLVKGSHIIVPKLHEGNQAYFLQSDDKRVIFAIPYHGFTMIGTTDKEYDECIDEVSISEDEIDYLCDVSNQYFKCKISKSDVVNSWSGLRPLIKENKDNLHEISRDYFIDVENQPASLISIYGGKITTYRKLAEDAIERSKLSFKNLGPSLSSKTLLPGAAYEDMSFDHYHHYAHQQYQFISPQLLAYYLQNYGTLAEYILKDSKKIEDLGQHFGHQLYEKEVNYLIQHEWVKKAEDVLWRRTKQGLHFPQEAIASLDEYINTENMKRFS